MENQKRVKALTEEHGADNIVVLFGAAEAEAAGLSAETVTLGDPTYAGPLTNVALKLPVYHVVESEFKDAVDAAIYEDQIGMMEMVLDVDEIVKEMNSIREQVAQ